VRRDARDWIVLEELEGESDSLWLRKDKWTDQGHSRWWKYTQKHKAGAFESDAQTFFEEDNTPNPDTPPREGFKDAIAAWSPTARTNIFMNTSCQPYTTNPIARSYLGIRDDRPPSGS
jgi:hypothetical protein